MSETSCASSAVRHTSGPGPVDIVAHEETLVRTELAPKVRQNRLYCSATHHVSVGRVPNYSRKPAMLDDPIKLDEPVKRSGVLNTFWGEATGHTSNPAAGRSMPSVSPF